jgi:hypothetical protein
VGYTVGCGMAYHRVLDTGQRSKATEVTEMTQAPGRDGSARTHDLNARYRLRHQLSSLR